MKNKVARYGLSIYSDYQKLWLFYLDYALETPLIRIKTSTNGVKFSPSPDQVTIVNKEKKPIKFVPGDFWRIGKLKNQYLLIYKTVSSKLATLQTAVSADLTHWQQFGCIPAIKSNAMVVPDYQFNKQYVFFFGGKTVDLAFSPNLKQWSLVQEGLLKAPPNIADPDIEIGNLMKTSQGILLIYALKVNEANWPQYSLWAALWDKDDPQKLLWSSKEPIWQIPEELADHKIVFLGTTVLKGNLFAYLETQQKGIFAVKLVKIKQLFKQPANFFTVNLKRLKDNPILKPILGHFWESKAVFNPAALHEKGRIHLVYRAIGDDDISVLGYASSPDGLKINERLPKPIFTPKKPYKTCSSSGYFYASPFMSGGGGYGGCEDPRLTKIGDTIYMTYVAYDGGSPPRIALTSIQASDFLAHEWYWQEPVLISPPGVVDKNACLLPEKVQNKYVIFHRIYPNILVDFVDDLDFDGETKWLRGDFVIPPRPTFWDSRKVGAGPPPIKTKDGWLLIYHAVGDQDPSRYKMGAMLLDLKDPSRVRYRSDQPILEPDAWYENEGFKTGVVYPCGAVVKDGQLLVYYGGADMVVCAAKAKLNEFTNQLKNTGMARLYALN